MSNRLKLKTAAPATREEMETLVGRIAELKTEDRALKAQMDAELKRVREDYQSQFSDITDELATLMPRALAWAESNPEDFGKARSIEMLHGVIGWRRNTPSLKTLKGWTWDRVLERLLNNSLVSYYRNKQEVNKAAILDAREELGDDGLRKLGVQVVQEDEFFVEPKLTTTEKREVLP